MAAAPYDQARPAPLIIGVVSDTHGYLYPQVAELLQGVDHIIHAGDIGSFEVLQALRRIASVTAVRGNVDFGGWADALPSRAEVNLGGVCFVVGHIAPRLDGERGGGQPAVVVSGHSHRAALEQRENVLYLNPGSAGPRRFGRPRSIARLEIWPQSDGAESGEAAASGEAEGASPRVTAQIVTVDGD